MGIVARPLDSETIVGAEPMEQGCVSYFEEKQLLLPCQCQLHCVGCCDLAEVQ